MGVLGSAPWRRVVALLKFLLAVILAAEAYDIISVIGFDSAKVPEAQPQVYAHGT